MVESITPDGDIAVAIGQFAPTPSLDENLGTIAELAYVAVRRGARMLVLPEYSSHFEPELGVNLAESAEGLDGRFVRGLRELAGATGLHLVAGMLERIDGSRRCFNTLVAVAPSGDVVATYRKQHLYDAFGHRESDLIAPGGTEPPQTFELDGVTVGMQTCYDIRFPEVTRRLVDARADVVLVPSEWVRGPLKEHHWRTLLRARAIENTIYIVAADHPPPIGVGLSAVIDPMGVEIAAIGEESDVAVAYLSRSRIARVRSINPALALRRYGVVPLG